MSALRLFESSTGVAVDPIQSLDDPQLIRRVLGLEQKAADKPRRGRAVGARAAGVASGGVAVSRDAAFATLVGRHQERIFKLLTRFTHDVQETEDLAQEVFVKVFRKLDTFQFDSSFFTWLYRIAVNTASDYMARKRRRPVALAEDIGELDQGGTAHPRDHTRERERPEDALLQREMAEVTRRILDLLPPKDRTALVLREYEDLAYTEMAETLGCSIGTVESRLFRARQRFKAELSRLHPELVPESPDRFARPESPEIKP